MDDRDMLLGELMAQALVAFDEGRSSDVDRILDEAGDDRAELLDMIELALTLHGPVEPSEAAIRATAALPVFEPRAWPEILTDARHAQSLQRATVIERIATAVGLASPAALAQLRVRYHELETGQISPAGVSERLIDALGDALGGIRGVLDATRQTPTGPLRPAVSFRRDGFEDLDEIADEMLVLQLSSELPPPSPDERAVDELFGV